MVIIPRNRRKISKRLVVALFCVTFIIAGIFVLRNKKEMPYWQDLEISPIHLNGVEADFAVKDGKIFKNGKRIYWVLDHDEYKRVLRVVLFYQNLKEDPILFDENLDVSMLRSSLDRLRKLNESSEELAKTGPVQPLEFLDSFADSSLAFQDFSKNISEENATISMQSLEKASQKYNQEAERISTILNENKDAGSRLGFLGGETFSNLQITRDDFEKIKKNSQVLQDEIEKRKRCLDDGDCEARIDFKKPDIPDDLSVPNIEILSKEKLEVNDPEAGPFLVSSPCWKKRDASLLFFAQKCSTRFGCLSWPFLADDTYFTKLVNAGGRGGEMYKLGNERGVQSSSGPYACVDQTYKPKIQTVALALEKYSKERLFGEKFLQFKDSLDDFENIQQEGGKIESLFFDAKYPSDKEMDILADYYGYVYSRLVKKNASSESRDEFLQRALVLKGKIDKFDLILNRIAFHFNNAIEKKVNIGTGYTFLVWSNYSVTFLNFSPFVWKINERAGYLEMQEQSENAVRQKTKNAVYLDYSEATDIYGEDIVQKWLRSWDGDVLN